MQKSPAAQSESLPETAPLLRWAASPAHCHLPMDMLRQFLNDFWFLSEEMAPYLLLGFLIAAILRIVVDEAFVRRHLGQKGWRQTVKAAVLGVPLPLCSCGVIPVAASLRRQGGSAGAVTSFTASTPQTGVDSIFATAALLNWPFALIRVLVAFVNGVLAGTLVDRFADREISAASTPKSDKSAGCCASAETSGTSSAALTFSAAPAAFTFSAAPTPIQAEAPVAASCCGTAKTDSGQTPCCCSPSKPGGPFERMRDAFRFGFITLPADIGKALLFGLLIAALIGVLLPSELGESTWTTGILAYVVTTLVAVPLYVCSTGSIPMAYALVSAGFSPGSALVFLIAGPATNTATIAALWKMIGPRAVAIYVVTLIAVAWISGFLVDQSGLQMDFHGHHAHEAASTGWKTGSAVLLYLLLGYAFWRSARDRQKSAKKQLAGRRA